jgi:hypothetical protein
MNVLFGDVTESKFSRRRLTQALASTGTSRQSRWNPHYGVKMIRDFATYKR